LAQGNISGERIGLLARFQCQKFVLNPGENLRNKFAWRLCN
jgi:hypothetical protein